MKQTITAVIPALNEENNIARCLAALGWCDEVMVICMGDDRTADTARKLGATVIEKPKSKTSDFRAVQEHINWACDHVSTDWILRVDADEVVTDELAQEIRHILDHPTDIVAYGVPRKQFFAGGFLKGGDWAYDRLIRLFKPKAVRYDPIVAVHEQFKVKGPTGTLKHNLLHYSHPTLKDALRKFDIYTTLEAEHTTDPIPVAAVKMIALPPYIFLRWMIWHHGYRDGARGVVAGAMRGYYDFLLYGKYLKKRLSRKD